MRSSYPRLGAALVLVALVLLPAVALAAGPTPSPSALPSATPASAPSSPVAIPVTQTLCPELARPTQKVSGDMTVFGSQSTLAGGTEQQGNVLVMGGEALINGWVDGSVTVFGGQATLGPGARINGDAAVMGGQLSMGSCSVVTGNVSVLGGQLNRANGSVVQGVVNTTDSGSRVWPGPGPWIQHLGWFDPVGSIASILLGFFFLGSMAVLAALILPLQLQRVEDAIAQRPWESLGLGCVSIPALFVLSVALAITLIGLLVLPVLWLAAAVAWLFGLVAVGVLLGRRLLQAAGRPSDGLLVMAVVGAVLLVVIGAIPLLGWLLVWVVGLLGFGALVITRGGTRLPSGDRYAPEPPAGPASAPLAEPAPPPGSDS